MAGEETHKASAGAPKSIDKSLQAKSLDGNDNDGELSEEELAKKQQAKGLTRKAFEPPQKKEKSLGDNDDEGDDVPETECE